jgi:hypothetical protein
VKSNQQKVIMRLVSSPSLVTTLLFATSLTGAIVSADIWVVDDFLTDETEVQSFLDGPRRAPKGNVRNGFAQMKPALVRRILDAAGVPFSMDRPQHTREFQTPFLVDDDTMLEEGTVIQTRSILEGSTPVHQDRFWKDHSVVQDKVGFIFLNENKDAMFVHGDVHVQPKKGSLVVFDGHIPHHTIVGRGEVNLAGPFHVSPSMAFVGAE